MAGLAVAGLLVPEAVAYAAIAGLPPSHALIAAVAGLGVYAVVGGSRFAIVSPTSSAAAVLAAGLATLSLPGIGREDAALLLVVMAGCLFGMASVLRLGFVASFVSRPVLRGFAMGLALTIVIKQLPVITGIAATGLNPLALLYHLLSQAGQWHWASTLLGGVALAVLLVLKRWPSVPGGIVVLVAGIALSSIINLPAHHIALVGSLQFALALPAVHALDIAQVTAIAAAAAPLALIIFVEAWGTTRSLGLRHGESLRPNRELAALGAANLIAGVAGGMPVGAGFSASSAAEAAGATSRRAGAAAAVVVAVMATAGRPLIALIPEPVLAAVVIAALLHALDPRPIVRLWHLRRDAVVASVAVAAVLLLGVLNGMLVAVLLSIAALIRRLSTPNVAVLGQLGTSTDYVDVTRHPDAGIDVGILVVRPSVPIFFANAERIFATIEALAAQPTTRGVVLSLEDSDDLDSSAIDALGESLIRLTARGQSLTLAHLKDPVRDILHLAGEGLAQLAEQGARTVAAAIVTARSTRPPAQKE